MVHSFWRVDNGVLILVRKKYCILIWADNFIVNGRPQLDYRGLGNPTIHP
jgi:hypothetical protein